MRWLLLLLVGCSANAAMPGGGGGSSVAKDFYMEVRKGNVPKHSMVLVAGHEADISTSFATVAPFDSPQIIDMMPSAQACGVASTSANDTSAGTGTRQVVVTCIAGGDSVAEIITLNGQTKVSCSGNCATATAINGLGTWSVGSGGVNDGTVYVGLDSDTFTSGVPTTHLFAMEAGWNTGRSGVYTVPSGFSAYITGAVFSSGPGKVGTGRIVVRLSSGDSWRTVLEMNETEATAQLVTAHGSPAVPAGGSVRLDAEIDATTGPFMFTLPLLLVED